IFREEKGKYHLTPLAEPLCVDAPDSVHPWAIMVGENWHRDAWSGLLDTVRSGESAFERTHGMNTFQYFTEHPEAGAVFHAVMGSFTRQVAEPLLTAYDFSQSGKIIDIGGGNGTLLIELLKRYPELQGALYELPQVLLEAREALLEAQCLDRCELIEGDFFTSVP